MKIKNFFTIFALGTILALTSCSQDTTNFEKDETSVVTSGSVSTTTAETTIKTVTRIASTATVTSATLTTSTTGSINKITNTTTKLQDIKPVCAQPLNQDNEAVIEILATPTNTETNYSNTETIQGIKIDNYSRTLLAEIVYHEAGCDWINTYDKARIVAGVMNRVYDERFPSTVYDVLTQQGQFTGYTPGCVIPNEDCYAAVDYYFVHADQFGNENSWYGTGYENIFYYQ